MPFDLFVFQESFVEYVQFKLLASDKVVGVAVNLPRVDGSSSVCCVSAYTHSAVLCSLEYELHSIMILISTDNVFTFFP